MRRMEKICVVDDNPVVLRQLAAAIRVAGYGEITAFDRPLDALMHCRRDPPAVILVDYLMGDTDGLGLIRSLREDPATRAIAPALMSGTPPGEFKRAAYRAGALDVLTKPMVPAELRPKLEQLLAAAARRRDPDLQPEQLESQFIRCLERIAKLGDGSVPSHTERLSAYVEAIACRIDPLPAPAQLMGQAARLLDLGKVVLPEGMAVRRGSSMTQVQRQLIERRATTAYDLLRDLPGRVFEIAAEIALAQFERWDGGGLPRGLVGNAIPLSARVVAVAKAFELITTIEGRDAAWLASRARAVIEAESSGHYDPMVVRAFLAAFPDLLAISLRFGAAAEHARPGSREALAPSRSVE